MVNNQQLTFEGAMRIVQGNKWIQLKDIERLEKFIQNQQVTISALKEENEQLKFENETLKSNYQREMQSSIDFCNAYSKTNGELLEEIEKLEKQNEQLRQENNFLKQIREAFQIDVKNSRQMLKRW